MPAPTYDVVGVGNAIVDVIASVDDGFIDENGLVKGAMTLIDQDRAESLYAKMPPGVETSGGSAANTLAGVASFGGSGAYIGKVRDDQLGDIFGHDLRSIGVTYDIPPSTEGPSTARCLIQVTPDAERTMNTFLGISAVLESDDYDDAMVAGGKIVYCEGYLWDTEPAKAAIRHAMAVARQAGGRVSMTLSDPFCVDRHREEWLGLIDGNVDVLFANDEELLSLFQTDSLDTALQEVSPIVEIAAVTLGAEGSVIVTGGDRLAVAVEPVQRVVDTTGAGDLYAAGFLFGLANDLPLAECGRLGSLAAAEVISHVGARPQRSLAALIS